MCAFHLMHMSICFKNIISCIESSAQARVFWLDTYLAYLKAFNPGTYLGTGRKITFTWPKRGSKWNIWVIQNIVHFPADQMLHDLMQWSTINNLTWKKWWEVVFLFSWEKKTHISKSKNAKNILLRQVPMLWWNMNSFNLV